MKLLSNFIMLGILWLTVNFLGDEGRGEIAIFNANLALVILLNGFIGSSVIVYLTPRTNFYQLLIPAYIWCGISSLLSPFLLNEIFGFISKQYTIDTSTLGLQNTQYYYLLVLCSFIGSIFEFHYMVLIAKSKINQANSLNLIRTVLILVMLIFFFYFLEASQDVSGYFVAITFSYIIGGIISIVMVIRLEDRISEMKDIWKSTKEIVKLGFVDQASNVLQFLNRRLPLYTLYLTFGKGDTGVLNVALTLTESFLFLTQSISTIQYSRISNNKDLNSNRHITLRLFRLSIVALGLVMIGMSLLPTQIYIWAFKQDFEGLRSLIVLLALGTISYGGSTIFNHYYSGIGKFQQNVYSNSIALVFTIFIGCGYLIPKYGMWGAAMSISLSYLILVTYFILVFCFNKKQSYIDLIPKKSDFEQFWLLFKSKVSIHF